MRFYRRPSVIPEGQEKETPSWFPILDSADPKGEALFPLMVSARSDLRKPRSRHGSPPRWEDVFEQRSSFLPDTEGAARSQHSCSRRICHPLWIWERGFPGPRESWLPPRPALPWARQHLCPLRHPAPVPSPRPVPQSPPACQVAAFRARAPKSQG